MKKFFEKIKDFAKKHKKGLIIVLVIVLVISCIFGGCSIVLKNAVKTFDSMTETGEVSVQKLTRSVGSTGRISSIESKDITTTLTGIKVSKINVKVGDSVQVGDELAAFDTTDISENLSDTQKQLNVQNANQALSSADQQRNYNDTERNQNTNVLEASESFENAQKKYTTANENYKSAKNAYEAAQKALEADPANPDLIKDKNLKDTAEETARAEFESAEQNLNAAERRYYNAVAARDSALASQSSQMQQSANSASVSNISLKNQIKKYEEQLNEGVLKSPIAGVVTAINIKEGDTYTGGTVITVQDVSSYIIETEIGEYDIPDIAVGQTVLVKTEATKDEELEGVVTEVSPVASASSSESNVTYKVKIVLNDSNDRLRLGMSASLSIIIESHENAMVVPYTAIQKDADGRTYVQRSFEMDDQNAKKGQAVNISSEELDKIQESGKTGVDAIGEVGKVYVDVVMESNYYTEIKSDELKEGDKVMLITSSTADNLMDMMMQQEGF